MRTLQRGFTLIELVIVIVILGILAAAALPRFSDLSQDARIASLNGVAGSLRSGAAIAHATQLAKGYASNIGVSLEGASIGMTQGYPTAAGISGVVGNYDGFTFQAYVTSSEFRLSNLTSCRVNYAEASGGGTYTVSITSNGC